MKTACLLITFTLDFKFNDLTLNYKSKKLKGGIFMSTFFLFGKYSSEAINELSASRTEKAVELIKKFDGEINSMYALLGENDLVLIVNFPGIEQAIKASVSLTKLTGIAFSTSEALPVIEFDKIIGEI